MTILYDARCGLCSWARRWMLRQSTLIDVRFIPAGSAAAKQQFPGLDREGEPADELVVISDQGAVYRNDSAWIMCLFALEAYREWANRLAHPLLRPLARQAFTLLSKERSRVSRWLSLASEVEIAETLSAVNAPACVISDRVEADAGPAASESGVRPQTDEIARLKRALATIHAGQTDHAVNDSGGERF